MKEAQKKRLAGRSLPSLLQLELLALLEQLGPRPCGAGGGGAGACGAAAASGSAGSAGGAGVSAGAGGPHAGWPDLQLNHGVGRVKREEKGAGGSSSADGGSSSGGNTTPSWAAGPTWQQVAAAGGCPAPGTPPQLQLARLTALAAAEWLPVLITQLEPHAVRGWGSSTDASIFYRPFTTDVLPHKAYRVAWSWLRLVGRQALVVGPTWPRTLPGSAAASSFP